MAKVSLVLKAPAQIGLGQSMRLSYGADMAKGAGIRGALVPVACWFLAVLSLVAPLLLDAASGEADLTVPSPHEAAWWFGLLLVTAQAVVLARWVNSSVVVLIVCAAATPLAAVAGLADAVGATLLAVVVAAYRVGAQWNRDRTMSAVSVAAVLIAVGTALSGQAVWAGVVQGLGTVGLPVMMSIWVRDHREVRTARADQAKSLEREHEAQVQAAVARERTAMARELHDIAAHHLSGIAIMTAAINGQIDTDPTGAKAAVRDVRNQTTAVLRDLRSLVGLLRDGGVEDASAEAVRPESLAGIAALIEDVRGQGAVVAFEILGSDEPVGVGIGPLAQLAAYRMVQESLVNAARHSPGSRCVVSVDDRNWLELVVTVENGASTLAQDPVSGGGFGLIGMRERADLTDSRLDCGVTGSGGWRVTLRTPRQHDLTGELP